MSRVECYWALSTAHAGQSVGNARAWSLLGGAIDLLPAGLQACNEGSRRLLFEAELAAAKAREQLTAQKSVEALEADFR